MSHRLPDTGREAIQPRDGYLSPWACPVTGALGWQITTRTHRLALTVTAIAGGTVYAHEQEEWQARIPQAVLRVVIIAADADALWCRLGTEPHPGVFVLAFARWQAATVLKWPLAEFPAQGHLSVRDVRVTTRMGRTVRYLIPVFTPSQ